MHTRIASALIAPFVLLSPLMSVPAASREATPDAYRCEAAMPMSPENGTPTASTDGTPVMAMGTPSGEANHDMTGVTMDIDQVYIDMMIPHHASIIAMAEAARDRLRDPRLATMAENVIVAQSAEITELQGLREQFFGSGEPMPMDAGMMDTMATMTPGMDMTSMALLMDPAALVDAFCAAPDPDLAFVDLTIPHHQMAVDASRQVLAQTVRPEIRTIAERVIQDQTREITELEAIRQALPGVTTPASTPTT